jgi:hypothetical protein
LWGYFLKHGLQDWATWESVYLGVVREVEQRSDEALVSPQGQELLWNARRFSSIGPGEAVNVRVLFGDNSFALDLVRLRRRVWPNDPQTRATQLQSALDSLLQRAVQQGVRVRPQARLLRAFAVLLPQETTCLFSWPSVRAVSYLLWRQHPKPPVEAHVLIRARLREVLGQEADLTEQVRRSLFCWWLYARFDLLKNLSPDVTEKDLHAIFSSLPTKPDSVPPPLELWPFTKQFKGNAVIAHPIESYQSAISAAESGSSFEDLVRALGSQVLFAQQNESSRRLVLSRLIGLGFLYQKENKVLVSRAGHELVESGSLDILVERLLERVFGFAQLLRLLKNHPQGLERDLCNAAQQKLYPQWTSTRMPSALRGWARVLGLAESGEKNRWKLTEYGAAWEARLPEKLPEPPREEVLDDEPPASSPREVRFPDFAELLKRLSSEPGDPLVIDEKQVAALCAAWAFYPPEGLTPRKRFAILSGLSGTGKTLLLSRLAEAVCAALSLDSRDHVALVPVSPDWHDPSGLLGYVNALHSSPSFQREPALDLLLRAAENPSRPYFLLLDEMNLARVERYFAPFLSAMESGGDLVLHSHGDALEGIPERVPWPQNLCIAGTVNMDESTHAISDKVLDRAFTLEFWEVKLETFFAKNPAGARYPNAENLLLAVYQKLLPLRRHFGYRTAGEVLGFVAQGASLGNSLGESFFLDQAMFSKVLPRLRGEESPLLRKTLEELRALFQQENCPLCAEKLRVMLDSLQSSGLTKFWS